MESVFQHWLQLAGDYERDAITGLKELNTPVSRAMIAAVAAVPSSPNNFTQSEATSALAELGDRQYYPLMLQLLSAPEEEVRRVAVGGVARLGGEEGVARLLDLVRNDSSLSYFAVTALGGTASRTAVKGLIDLMVPPAGSKPIEPKWPLFVLTHHQLPAVNVPRTPVQAQQEWQRWWETTGKDAPVHRRDQCGPKYNG